MPKFQTGRVTLLLLVNSADDKRHEERVDESRSKIAVRQVNKGRDDSGQKKAQRVIQKGRNKSPLPQLLPSTGSVPFTLHDGKT